MKVFLLPNPFFGHMIPFLQLGQALARAGVDVHYVATPRNIERLRKLADPVNSSFHFVELPMPVLPENPLPEGAESSADIPFEKQVDLYKTYDLLEQPFKQFVADNSPDWLILDISPYWAVDIARECSLPSIIFLIFSAAATAFRISLFTRNQAGGSITGMGLADLTSTALWGTFPSKVAYRHFEAADILSRYNSSSVCPDEATRLAKIVGESKAISIRSCREIEGDYLGLIPLVGKPVVPVGLLPPSRPQDDQQKLSATGGELNKVFCWLDEQKPKSVVYVAFGSNSNLTREQILEVAYGLEESELSFLLVLRDQDNSTIPLEFFDRTARQGRVWFGWAPQWRVLAHPGVGGFLSHAGWGSFVEALLFGPVSLIFLPLFDDQGLNARSLVDKGLGIEVDRNEFDGSFSRKDVAKSLKQAMGQGEEGERLRERATEASAVVKDSNLQDQYIDELVKFLHDHAYHKSRVNQESIGC